MKKFFLPVVFLTVALFAAGHGRYRTPETKIDTTFIRSFYNDLVLRVYLADKGNNFVLNDRSNDLNIRFRPNDYYKIGFGVNHKWFGLKIGFELPFSNGDEAKFGKSSSFGLQSYVVARRFMLDVVAMKTEGYYLRLRGKNAGDFVLADHEVYDVQSNLSSLHFGVNLIYVLNYKRFSYKAAFNQTDMQIRSAGSVIFGGGFSSFEIDGSEHLVPDEISESYFKPWAGLSGIHSYSAYGSFGYAYSWVPLKRSILTGALTGRIGVRYNELDLENRQKNFQTKPGFGGELRISGGYNFPWVYVGASFVQEQFNSDVRFNSLQFSNGTSFFEFTISKRIKL